jgi:hypothetical protein
MGVGLTAVASFASGATEGYDRARKRDMEDERLKWERQDQEEKQMMRDARDEYAKQMSAARQQFATGKLPGQEENVIPQQPDQQVAPADLKLPHAPVSLHLSKQQHQQLLSSNHKDPTANIFKNNGEGSVQEPEASQRCLLGRLRDITANYYEKTGQVDKVMDLDKKINEWKNSSYDELRKATAAAIVTGDRGAMKMASHLASLTGLGFKVDPDSGTYDPEDAHMDGCEDVRSRRQRARR